ncbi:MAG: tRNA (adenosine(37)-N6)-dimethylallyltransferase MiaA [Labilithrix sp.]|nr:tRNA (adenosine(37)-N6)-dimethylallyltransferase MiaA [Labilithrix sp.]
MSARALARALELARGPRLLCIVGPTASGKTDLALGVAEAVGGEIVSADSVQIYRGFDVGSGKPSREEIARAPHHLVDTHDPGDPVDAAGWARLAEAAVEDIRARGKIPIVCGGTFFWIRALVLGLVEAPAADAAVRARHKAIVDERGRAALHDELARVDPPSARRLHPNDTVRVSRALEVYELSGRTMSDWQAAHGFKTSRFDAALVALEHDPAKLTERIAARVDVWLAHGWIDEVRRLLDAGHGEARAMGSVGYAEVRAHLEGKLPRDELRDAIVRSTRVFARRQRTWLNGTDQAHARVEWL